MAAGIPSLGLGASGAAATAPGPGVGAGISPPAGRDQIWRFKDRGGTLHFTNVPSGDRRYQPTSLPQMQIVIGRPVRSSATARWAAPISPWLSDPPADVRRLVSAASSRHDLEPALIHAVIRAESGYNPQARSPAGACGLMQLMPGTADDMGVRDVFHPGDNIQGGAAYLRAMLDRFNGNLRLALAAYNAGPGAVESYGGVPPYPETMDYVERVLRFRDEFTWTESARTRRGARVTTEVARR